MDTITLALLNATILLENASPEEHVSERYSGWDDNLCRLILAGEKSLADLSTYSHDRNQEPQPFSRRQKDLESLVN
jgi:xylose isomerase